MEPDDRQITGLLDDALTPLRSWPRLVAWPQEVPDFTAHWLAAQREQGWFGDGLCTVSHEGQLVSLGDVRVEGERALIGWFATHPDHRRQGYASDCLQQALAYAVERGATAVRTHSFVDSRNAAACAFLEHHGFIVRDPDHQNMVMPIDMSQYQPVPIVLPEGCRIETMRPEWIPQWLQTKDRVFGGATPPDWFEKTFSHRWDFEWAGWMTLWRGEEMVGISGADLFRDPAHPESYSGAQIEYVGVVEGHRGLRLGEIIVRACLNYIKARGLPCQLITQRFRVPAVTLYEKLGFRFQRENRTYEKTL